MWTLWDNLDRMLTEMNALREEMDNLFGRFGFFTPEAEQSTWTEQFGYRWPRFDFADKGDYFVVTGDVPGLTADDIKVTLTQDLLTIQGERKVEAPEGYNVLRQERPSFRFTRSFTMPAPVDAEKTRATVKNGVLTVELHKAAEARPRHIKVKMSK